MTCPNSSSLQGTRGQLRIEYLPGSQLNENPHRSPSHPSVQISWPPSSQRHSYVEGDKNSRGQSFQRKTLISILDRTETEKRWLGDRPCFNIMTVTPRCLYWKMSEGDRHPTTCQMEVREMVLLQDGRPFEVGVRIRRMLRRREQNIHMRPYF